MAEWLFETGIGENRAILIEDDLIVEAAIERPSLYRAGAVIAVRLANILVPHRRAIAMAEDGTEFLVEPVPAGIAEGARVRAVIVREVLAEQGRAKIAKARITDDDQCAGPSLRQRLDASPHPVTDASPIGPDRFEAAGWSELLEEAQSGEIAFAGGTLRMSLTPAMTLFDVDGALPPAALAVAGARAAGQAIRRFGLAGSIGIDLPTLAAKEERQQAAAALDAVLPQPFERTAVNGFGFLQIVRRRERASIPELLQGDPAGAAARALLRNAERATGSGPRTLHAAPPVISVLEAQPEWIDTLSRRIGAPVALRAEPGLAISAGYVHSLHP